MINRSISVGTIANWCIAIVLVSGTAFGQQRLVELSVLADSQGELGEQQNWLEMLEQVGADRVQIKSSKHLDQPSIEEIQADRVTIIKVTGVLAGRSLRLPGAQFGNRDTAGIKAYLQKLRDDGSQVALAEKKAFGLTSEQLVALNEELSKLVAESTANRPSKEVVGELISLAGIKVQMAAASREAIESAGVFADELKGLSTGTALAAAIRPAGLVLVPRREQGKPVELTIQKASDVDEHWPIGWPIDEAVSSVEPKLFQRRDVEIRDFLLKDGVAAVAGIAEIPVLYDWNSLARKEVDLATVKVTYIKKKSPYYMTIVDMLKQAKPKLSVEVRLDENAKPFLWIN